MKKENVVVKQSSHSRGMLSGIYNACRCKIKDHSLINRCVEDPRYQPSGMTPLFNNNAFTLIELLVVVLIIGILAAVAVPQYQKAVYKARAAEAILLASELEKAVDVYNLETGFTTGQTINLSDKLNITIAPNSRWYWSAYNEGEMEEEGYYIVISDEDLQLELKKYPQGVWQRTCTWGSNRSQYICQSLETQGWTNGGTW